MAEDPKKLAEAQKIAIAAEKVQAAKALEEAYEAGNLKGDGGDIIDQCFQFGCVDLVKHLPYFQGQATVGFKGAANIPTGR